MLRSRVFRRSFGSSSEVLNCAIIGTGPAGFYTAKYLLKKLPFVRVHLFDALPVPFGLVRYGVAPDHPDVKAVTNDFEKVMSEHADQVAYFGNVRLGTDVTLEELQKIYGAVVLSYGTADDKRLGIPGENELKGIYSARSFVNWYNGHPSFADAEFPLDAACSTVIGQGNVAVDVARMLAQQPSGALRSTDTPAHVLHQLASTACARKATWLIGRRGPVQAQCTTKELRELTKLPHVRMSVAAADMRLNAASEQELGSDRAKKRKWEIFQSISKVEYSPACEPLDESEPFARQMIATPSSTSASPALSSPAASSDHHLRMAFLWRPVRFLPDPRRPDWVGGLLLRRCKLVGDAGKQSAVDVASSDEAGGAGDVGAERVLPTRFVLRSIGYQAQPVPGVPFDAKSAVVPSLASRVLKAAASPSSSPSSSIDVVQGLYVTGWLRRGPSGIIGSNIVDAQETVESIVADVHARKLKVRLGASNDTSSSPSQQIASILQERRVRYIDWAGWRRIDEAERKQGASLNKPREKLVRVEGMLKVAGSPTPIL